MFEFTFSVAVLAALGLNGLAKTDGSDRRRKEVRGALIFATVVL